MEAEGVGGDAAAARRRIVLLGGAIALPVLLVLAGFTAAWPLLALPLCLALPLGGHRGMATAVCVAGVTIALVSDRPGTDGVALAIGIGAFAVTGLAVGAGHRARTLDVERMASLSFTDRLTGLHNYAFFADALPRECRRAERYDMPLSLVLMDLDRFKDFNDRYGHDAGNRMLAAVGQAIASSTRATDMPVRYGGEEFALIVPGPADEGLEAAERVRAAVGRVRVMAPDGEAVGTTISAGVADFRTGADDLEGALMLRQADTALYRSKADGRDRVSLHASEDRWAAVS
jgi:diguanylate cyclase (GGDEF)-like protein